MFDFRPFAGVCLCTLLVFTPGCSSDSAPGGDGTTDPVDTSQADTDESGVDASDAGEVDENLDAADASSTPDADASSGDAADTGDAATGDTTDDSQLWRPAPGTSWHWQLQGDLDTSLDVEMYDIDLFDTSAQTISDLQARGVAVICYFSAGSFEEWRSDAREFGASDYGEAMGDWPGEWWLDVRSENVRQIMQRRLDLAVTKGCDGVEPDNVDGYQNDTGFALTREDQLDYLRFLSAQAHQRNLSIGLKNSVGLVDALEPDFDWALNEECLAWSECDQLAPFILAGKAVFHAEYVDNEADGAAKRDQICGEPSIDGFSTLVFTWDLDGWWLACD